MRRSLPCLLLALLTAGCGPAVPAATPAPAPPAVVEIAFVGPEASARAFELGLQAAAPRGGNRLRLVPVVTAAGCAGRSELQAVLTAGSDPAVSAAALADCGTAGAAAVAMARRLQLPSVLWGQGLRAVTWTAPAAVPKPQALAGFVARYDLRAGLDPVACQDTAAFCSALAAAGLTVLPLGNPRRGPAVHPMAVWTNAPPLQAAALRHRLTAARLRAPVEGANLRSAAYLAAAGKAAVGTIAFSTAPPAADAAQLARLRARLARAPTPADVQAYAAGQVLAAAVLAAGPDRTPIAARLQTGVRSLPTAAGPVTFDRRGADVQPSRITVAMAGPHGWTASPSQAGATVSGSVYGAVYGAAH